MKYLTLALTFFAMFGLTTLTGCEDKNAIEEGAEEVSDEIDDAM